MPAPEPLHTPRLRLDPWSDAHTGFFGALARTPAVVRYVGAGTTWTDARIHEVSERNLEHWRAHQFGWRRMTLTGEADGDAPVGLIALNFAGDGSGLAAGEYEIGWWVDPSFWGRGLAREAAIAVRDEAFARVRAPSVVARIQPANAASLAVAAAVGLTHESAGADRSGVPFVLRRLTAEAWRTKGGSAPRAAAGLDQLGVAHQLDPGTAGGDAEL